MNGQLMGFLFSKNSSDLSVILRADIALRDLLPRGALGGPYTQKWAGVPPSMAGYPGRNLSLKFGRSPEQTETGM
jgi:hypothetical protein